MPATNCRQLNWGLGRSLIGQTERAGRIQRNALGVRVGIAVAPSSPSLYGFCEGGYCVCLIITNFDWEDSSPMNQYFLSDSIVHSNRGIHRHRITHSHSAAHPLSYKCFFFYVYPPAFCNISSSTASPTVLPDVIFRCPSSGRQENTNRQYSILNPYLQALHRQPDQVMCTETWHHSLTCNCYWARLPLLPDPCRIVNHVKSTYDPEQRPLQSATL